MEEYEVRRKFQEDLLQMFEEQLMAQSHKSEALYKRYKYLSSLGDNMFTPNNNSSDYEVSPEYVGTIKELVLSNLELELANLKESILKTSATIDSIRTQRAEEERLEKEKLETPDEVKPTEVVETNG